VILDEYLAIRLTTAAVQTTTATVDSAVYCTERYTSVILFITTNMDDHKEEKRTEFNCTQR